MQRRRVEASQPHGLHDDELKLVVGILGPVLDRLNLRQPPQMLADQPRVAPAPGVDDLDDTPVHVG